MQVDVHRARRNCLPFLFLSVLMPFSGCSEKPNVSVVTGTVKLDGKPLQSVHVFFSPDIAEGMGSRGKTDDQGNFTLQTEDLKFEGALPGTHKVSLRDTWYMRDYKMDPASGETIVVDIGEKSRISWDYSTHVNSPLTLVVEPGKPNHFDIKIGPNGKVIK